MAHDGRRRCFFFTADILYDRHDVQLAHGSDQAAEKDRCGVRTQDCTVASRSASWNPWNRIDFFLSPRSKSWSHYEGSLALNLLNAIYTLVIYASVVNLNVQRDEEYFNLRILHLSKKHKREQIISLTTCKCCLTMSTPWLLSAWNIDNLAKILLRVVMVEWG